MGKCSIYRVSINSFPDYTHLFKKLRIIHFFSKTINTWHKILETNLSNGKKKYVCIPRSFLVINVCNRRKILCSPCITIAVKSINNHVTSACVLRTSVLEFALSCVTGLTFLQARHAYYRPCVKLWWTVPVISLTL